MVKEKLTHLSEVMKRTLGFVKGALTFTSPCNHAAQTCLWDESLRAFGMNPNPFKMLSGKIRQPHLSNSL